jgi:putative ABC transport system ATP-binding protein
LKDVNMTVAPGEVVGLIGPSGSGKSTLLKCLGAVIEPTAGTHGAGRPDHLRRRLEDPRPARAAARPHRLRLPGALPDPLPGRDRQRGLAADAGRPPRRSPAARARELLEALDVAHRASAQPSELSGGEQQRVSIARALANRPPVILADEPTAPLDSERALAVVRILNRMATQYHTAIIVVTHDEKIIPTFKRIYHIRDGTHARGAWRRASGLAQGAAGSTAGRSPGHGLRVWPAARLSTRIGR